MRVACQITLPQLNKRSTYFCPVIGAVVYDRHHSMKKMFAQAGADRMRVGENGPCELVRPAMRMRHLPPSLLQNRPGRPQNPAYRSHILFFLVHSLEAALRYILGARGGRGGERRCLFNVLWSENVAPADFFRLAI